MKILLGAAPLILAIPLLIGAGLWQGKITLRWSDFPELKESAARLDNVPTEFGPWKGEVLPKVTAEIARAGGIVGDSNIHFTNKESGAGATMSIVCARLNDVQVHTPDRCFPAHGFDPRGDPAPVSVTLGNAEKVQFNVADYADKEKASVTRVYWSWSTDGRWQAPAKSDDIRGLFARSEPVFKLYVIIDMPSGAQAPKGEGPGVALIKDLIPQINPVLFPALAHSAKNADTNSAGAAAEAAKPTPAASPK